MSVLALAITGLFFEVGGNLGKIQFSEINTTKIYVVQNQSAVNNFLNTQPTTVPPQQLPSTIVNNVVVQAPATCPVGYTGVVNESSQKIISCVLIPTPTGTISTPNNMSTTNNVGDVLGCGTSCGSQKFGIQANSVLIDSTGKAYPSNTIVNVSPTSFTSASLIGSFITLGGSSNLHKLSLFDAAGHSIDLGGVQTVFTGVTVSNTNVIVQAQMAIYLDNKLSYSATLSGQGVQTNNTIPLFVNGQTNSYFTFANEGAGWQDASTHYFDIYVGNVTATVGTGFNTQSYKLVGNQLVYQLEIIPNSNFVTQSNGAVVYASDDVMKVCTRNAGVESFLDGETDISTSYAYGTPTSAPTVSVSTGGNLIGTIPGFSGVVPNVGSDGYVSGPAPYAANCQQFSGIPRNAPITVTAGSQTFNIQTPITQYTYELNCEGTLSAADGDLPSNIIFSGCTNNFNGGG